METSIQEGFVLPSKGLIYNKPFDPHVTLRSMTTMEEMKRLSPSDTPYKVMSDIIESCIQEKLPIHVYDMSIGDYQYLLYKLRSVTYGDEYKMTTKCPACGLMIEATANLDSLTTMEYDETVVDLLRLTLPKSNKLITIKYQTPRDLDTIIFKNDEFKKKSKSPIDHSLLFTVATMIDKVDGQTFSPMAVEEFVKNLPMKDINSILEQEKMLNERVGVDNDIVCKCSACNYEFVSSFCITSEFFRPTNNT